MVTRIGTFASQQMLLDAALRTQSRLHDTQIQVATQQKSQQFSGISRDAQRLINIKNSLATTDQYLQNITNVEKRLEMMNLGLERIDEIARDMRTIMRGAQNGDAANYLNLSTIAAQFRDEVVDLLNLRDDSRYLFAGSKIDTKPVDLANGIYTTPSPPPFDATPDTGYYQGNEVIQEARIDDGLVIQYGVTANESAFEKIIRALDTVANLTLSDPVTPAEQQVIRDAIETLNQALENNGTERTISELAASVGANINLLDARKNKLQEFRNFALRSIDEIEGIDMTEAVTKLNFQQIQLEASFQIIARVGNLSLARFLR